jgi:hypothetical protein
MPNSGAKRLMKRRSGRSVVQKLLFRGTMMFRVLRANRLSLKELWRPFWIREKIKVMNKIF